MHATTRRKILFVTGTDTGVGKTVITALLLCHLRQRGVDALACKPFSSGPRNDGRLLQRLQADRLSLEATNPYHFSAALAPLVAARRAGRRPPPPAEIERAVLRLADGCERLLVEGAGGVWVPLVDRYCVADLVRALQCEVLVVAANRLGAINHTVLTVRALQQLGVRRIQVILNQAGPRDASSGSNGAVLRGLLEPVSIGEIPFLGRPTADATT